MSYEPEGVRSYPGDYNSYKRQRDEERVLLENRARNLEREREHLEKFVDRFRSKGHQGRPGAEPRRSLEKMDTVELQGEHVSMSFRFPPTERSGKVALETKDLGKSYGGLEVLKGVNQHVQRGERVALLGVNGAQDSPLLRMLAGGFEATSAASSSAQHQARLLRAAPRRHAAPRGHRLRRGEVLREGRAAPADPLGAGRHAVRRARGGQAHRRAVRRRTRARVALAQLAINPGNVPLMDEPTNHLTSCPASGWPEALDTFDGTLLFVSHNRGFIRSLATTIWIVEGGNVPRNPGQLRRVHGQPPQRDQAPVDVSGAPVPEKKAPGNSTPSKAPGEGARAGHARHQRQASTGARAHRRPGRRARQGPPP
ncbi:MAG: ABC-F family ATP-binding cassette domain-containing protein [Sandaracinaceae bacterium]|nr:ABC-F family ATP-binding cassette domain-containing protein [Sandaracinaceae bacterium]